MAQTHKMKQADVTDLSSLMVSKRLLTHTEKPRKLTESDLSWQNSFNLDITNA